jgi:hypothetical protein
VRSSDVGGRCLVCESVVGSPAPAPQAQACRIDPVSSRGCERGTRGCIVEHAAQAQGWHCKARRSAVDPPQDCDWPFCGCDPAASKVLEVVEESGRFVPAPAVDPIASVTPEGQTQTEQKELDTRVDRKADAER